MTRTNGYPTVLRLRIVRGGFGTGGGDRPSMFPTSTVPTDVSVAP